MTHLIIAKNVSEVLSNRIGDFPQFYLGSIAPDAAHYRDNYISDYKKDSHLCVSDEKWGLITNNDEWINNVTVFPCKYIDAVNKDFILGYCAHILSDIYNNINVWTPFRLRYSDELVKGYGNLHHQESNKIDINFGLEYEHKDEFWRCLSESTGIDIQGIIYAAEMEKQKDRILNEWYRGKVRQDVSSNKIVTPESIMEFIDKATDYVIDTFRKHITI